MLTCGIDEAGRGPVIGPMVITGVLFDESALPRLQALGVKDSKQLSARRREQLFHEIKKIAKEIVSITVSAAEIDAAVLSQTTNLNWLEADTTVAIIEKLMPEKAYIDCPSTNILAYRDYLSRKLTSTAKLVVEHKADETYLEASAASIISKVLRDQEIEKIKRKIGFDFGSGYPADERTRKFLEQNWQKYPEIFRKSWEPYKRMVTGKQSSLNTAWG